MSAFSRVFVAASALAVATAAIAQTPGAPPPGKATAQMTPQELATWKKANGSFYVQCDGQPDDMSDGETAARVIGAIALIGLFAPAPEAANPAKRKFGAEGIAACSQLIDGAKVESSPARRIGLILGRGAHRIEAKDYAGAVADAELARKTAADAGLTANPYWAVSRGRGADLLEAAALYRMGKLDLASAVALRDPASYRHALLPLLATPRYYTNAPAAVVGEDAYADALNRAYPWLAATSADRLEQLGRFADAAKLRDALIDLARGSSPNLVSSLPIAQAAVSHALAGNAARAAELAKAAQDNFDKRKADGKPDPNPAQVIEQLDLYNIIRTAGGGDVRTARRLFAARSQWVSASFGSTVEVNRRLRAGAPADDLIGGLAQGPDGLWKARADEQLAQALARDADNRTLFAMFPATLKPGDFEAVAKNTWKVDKSPWILKPKKPDPEPTGYETMFSYGTSPLVMTQAYALHAALIARSRGHQGFVMVPVITTGIFAMRLKTGNAGDPGLPAPLFNDADTVIAALSPIIPDPVTLKARQAGRAAR